MRRVLVACVCVLVLSGCASGPGPAPSASAPVGDTAPSAETSSGADVPADDPSLVRDDEDGRSPDESVVALIEAYNKRDWGTAYSLYASPTVDPATALREWADADQTYIDFRALETRVTGEDTAWVHVTYSVTSTPASSSQQPVTLDEWWPVHKIDGAWKTQWMPRQ